MHLSALKWLPVLALGLWTPISAHGACCYFSAKDADILQPAQKAFLTWDPVEKVESFTVQPKFEGNAADFGMVIPTPARPKLDEMPRDFFKELAVYSILKKREQPQSKLLPLDVFRRGAFAANLGAPMPQPSAPPPRRSICSTRFRILSPFGPQRSVPQSGRGLFVCRAGPDRLRP